MKNIYPKSKGKIHPSPAPPSASGAGGGEALSVLKLLPAAIFALTAVLAFEDKEVVAYLMTRSINGMGPAAEDRRRCRRTGGVHRPLFDCGCFGCYTCFWSRWDCSKDRETIHTVVEAFEEHLASKERRKGKETKRRKKKKCKDEKREEEAAAVMERESDEKMAEISAAEENKGLEEGAVIVSEGCLAEEKEEEAAAADEAVESPAVSRGERRGWADVMGIFNSRLWSLWNPGV